MVSVVRLFIVWVRFLAWLSGHVVHVWVAECVGIDGALRNPVRYVTCDCGLAYVLNECLVV